MSSAIDYPRHVCALVTKSQANLKISRVSARDTHASVKFELICTVHKFHMSTSFEKQKDFMHLPKLDCVHLGPSKYTALITDYGESQLLFKFMIKFWKYVCSYSTDLMQDCTCARVCSQVRVLASSIKHASTSTWLVMWLSMCSKIVLCSNLKNDCSYTRHNNLSLSK